MQTFSAMWSEELGHAIFEAVTLKANPYDMNLTRNDAKTVSACVNQGIDAHLQACYVPDRGDSYQERGGRLFCNVSPESLKCLVRRLMEHESENGLDLASSICQTLDIELI